jgi:hypothetical protein
MNRDWRNGLIILVILMAGIGGFFIYQTYFNNEVVTTEETGQVAGETDDSAALPSGSAVTKEIKLSETQRVAGAQINPLEIVEDSRCPEGVQCIQAGTVRMRANVTARGDVDPQEVMFELGVPMTVGKDKITLVTVKPNTRAGAMIAPGDYLFTFTVVKDGGSEYFKG